MGIGRTLGSLLLTGSIFLFGYGIYKQSDPALNAGGIVAGIGVGAIITEGDKKAKERLLEEENFKLKKNTEELQKTLLEVNIQNNQQKQELKNIVKIKELENEISILQMKNAYLTESSNKTLPPASSIAFNQTITEKLEIKGGEKNE